MAHASSTSSLPTSGPIYKYNQAKQYLDENNIPKMFECLISSLMIDRPENLFTYLDKQIDEIKEIGLDKVNWETFIKDSHPTKNPLRVELIQDETSIKIKKAKDSADAIASYKPEVFELTETQEDDTE